MTNNYKWDLSKLYTGYDDPIFLKDYDQLVNYKIENVNTNTSFKQLEEIKDLEYRLRLYVTLRLSVEANNEDAILWSSKVLSACAVAANQMNELWTKILEDKEIKQSSYYSTYKFIIEEKLNNAKHTLPLEQQEILNLVYPTSKKAFSDMYYALTGNAKANYRGNSLPLTQVKNMCHDNDSKVRKDAFLAELEAYKPIETPLAFAVSAIKKQQLIEARLLGYKDPLEKMLIESRMSSKTLDAMMSSIQKYLPVFRKYLRTKAKMLGYDHGLPWYEIYATLQECDFNFSIEDCESYILDAFEKVGENLHEMTKTAFNEHWIDYPTYEGKQPGAFCENLGWIHESRIITNYNNTLSDIITVAHELGHAFHGEMIEEQAILNRDYCMPLAETASTFNENVMYNYMASILPKKEKLLVIDTQLSALCQNVLDIYARFLFEKSVFEHIEEGFLNAKQLCELMKEALNKSFGDGLDKNWIHPYRWITKVHYYIPDIAYYNFPYTFGALFSRGLYAKFKKEGTSFIPKYEKLLAATTTNTCENVASMADINIEEESFWQESLQSIADQIQDFLKELSA